MTTWQHSAALVVGAALGLACAPDRPACSPKALAELEARYVAHVVAACEGYTYDDCPVLPALRAQYAEEREGWVRCGP